MYFLFFIHTQIPNLLSLSFFSKSLYSPNTLDFFLLLIAIMVKSKKTTVPTTEESSSHQSIPISRCNSQGTLNVSKSKPPYNIITEYLLHSQWSNPIPMTAENMPVKVVSHAFMTVMAVPDDKTKTTIQFRLLDDTPYVLTKAFFFKAIGLSYPGDLEYVVPSQEQIKNFLQNIYYQGDESKTHSEILKKLLPTIWESLGTTLSKCLTGRVGSSEYISREIVEIMYGIYTGIPQDFYSTIWNGFRSYSIQPVDKKPEVKLARFWSLVLVDVYEDLKKAIPSQKGDEVLVVSKFQGIVKNEAQQQKFGPPFELPEHMLNVIPEDFTVLAEYKRIVSRDTLFLRPAPFSKFGFSGAEKKPDFDIVT